MSVRAEVDMSDVRRLQNWLSDVEKYTSWNVDDLIAETMRASLQSARLATKPKSRAKELPQKYTVRPLVPMPANMGFWYTQKGKEKPFKVSREFTRAELKRKGLVRVAKAIKIWQKGKGWVYRPWAGKKNKNLEAFKIPHPGLARDAWGWLIPKFPSRKGKAPRALVSKVNARTPDIASARRKFLLAEAINKVTYSYKSSPRAASIGLKKGVNSIIGRKKKQLERAIERRFNR